MQVNLRLFFLFICAFICLNFSYNNANVSAEHAVQGVNGAYTDILDLAAVAESADSPAGVEPVAALHEETSSRQKRQVVFPYGGYGGYGRYYGGYPYYYPYSYSYYYRPYSYYRPYYGYSLPYIYG